MSKWMNQILGPAEPPDIVDHIAIEDIARLAEGTLDSTARKPLLHHINQCRRCYDILHHTLQDAPFETSGNPPADPWWKSKTAYALAASIILLIIIGGQVAYRHWIDDSKAIYATLDLDQELKDILMENDALRIEKGPRLNRLLVALQQKGLPVKNLNLVVLSKPYYQKKSLFGPREILHIRIENEVGYVEIREANGP